MFWRFIKSKGKLMIWVCGLLITAVLLSPYTAQARRTRNSSNGYTILSQEEREKLGFKEGYEVLLKDSAGRIYYVYQDVDKEDYERKIEKFVYALSKGIVNLCEIKTIDIRQVIGTKLAKWMFDHGYTELVVSRVAQNYKLADLTQKKHSAEGLIVFYTLIRDMNLHKFESSEKFEGLYMVEGEFISYDHDKSLREEEYFLGDLTKMTEELAFRLPSMWSPLFRETGDRELDYRAIVEIALKFQHYSDAEIIKMIEESGLKEYPRFADSFEKFLVNNRNTLMEDLVTLIKVVKGIDLRQYF